MTDLEIRNEAHIAEVHEEHSEHEPLARWEKTAFVLGGIVTGAGAVIGFVDYTADTGPSPDSIPGAITVGVGGLILALPSIKVGARRFIESIQDIRH